MNAKIRMCILIVLAFLISVLSPLTLAETERPLGDVTGDKVVDSSDASAILRHLVRLQVLSEDALANGDVNLNGSVDSADASCILRYVVKLDTLPPSPTVPHTTPTPPPAADALAGKIIILDPGHGYDSVTGSLYGGRMANNGTVYYAEADRVLTFALETKELLEAHGATVILTRSDRYMVGNYVRVSSAAKCALNLLYGLDEEQLNSTEDEDERLIIHNRLDDYDFLCGILDSIMAQYRPGKNEDNGELASLYYFTPYTSEPRVIHPDTRRIFEYEKDPRLNNIVYISLHTNAAASSQSGLHRGLLVYCVDNGYNPTYYDGYQSENSLRLGHLLNANITEQTGLIKKSEAIRINDYFMLRENNLPTVLLEIGYHDNADDLAIISAEQTPKNVANGILLSLIEYFID